MAVCIMCGKIHKGSFKGWKFVDEKTGKPIVYESGYKFVESKGNYIGVCPDCSKITVVTPIEDRVSSLEKRVEELESYSKDHEGTFIRMTEVLKDTGY